MQKIKELDSHIANLIAAGEVVERPASVIKELVENSIDAGAKTITVELRNGGISYLRIVDDGCGMSLEDAKMAFKRHATSKIKSEEDLTRIETLGFRGEALAAISSVSKIDLITRHADDDNGFLLKLRSGEDVVTQEIGSAPGTTFIIKDLFYNTPARMKFLKKDYTEAGYVISVIERAALSNPEIRFKIIKDGKTVFVTPGSGNIYDAVYSVYGKSLTEQMFEVPNFFLNGIQICGYISKPYAARPNRTMQNFFVNDRYVQSKLMMAAFEEAYKNSLIKGKYPYGVIKLYVSPSLVDVNVHPAKTEVKFAYEKQVFEAIYAGCKNMLDNIDNSPELGKGGDDDTTFVNEETSIFVNKSVIENGYYSTSENEIIEPKEMRTRVKDATDVADIHQSGVNLSEINYNTTHISSETANDIYNTLNGILLGQDRLEIDTTRKIRKPYIEMDDDEVEDEPVSEDVFIGNDSPYVQDKILEHDRDKFVGECFGVYGIFQNKRDLILVDKHAAQERLIFNKLMSSPKIDVQMLLNPCIIQLSGEDYSIFVDGMQHISELGFDAEPFGDRNVIIRGCPIYLDAADVENTICDILGKIRDKRDPTPDRFEEMVHSIACKAAIKAGDKTDESEYYELLRQMEEDVNSKSCPHGRPTVIRMSKYDIDKLFKRVNQ